MKLFFVTIALRHEDSRQEVLYMIKLVVIEKNEQNDHNLVTQDYQGITAQRKEKCWQDKEEMGGGRNGQAQSSKRIK